MSTRELILWLNFGGGTAIAVASAMILAKYYGGF